MSSNPVLNKEEALTPLELFLWSTLVAIKCVISFYQNVIPSPSLVSYKFYVPLSEVALEKLAKKLWKCQNSRSFVMPLKGNFRVSDSIFDFKLGTKSRTLNSKLKTRHSKENSAKERPLMSYWSLLFLMFSKDVHIEVFTLQNKGK